MSQLRNPQPEPPMGRALLLALLMLVVFVVILLWLVN